MTITYDISEINDIVKQVWEACKVHKVWAFDAEMGSGKTTFINNLCKYLEVEDEVNSPTFAIINEYYSPLVGKIYHTDWYRLQNEEAAIGIGVEDILNSNNYCFIEWPNNAAELINEPYILIKITTRSPTKRLIIIEAIGTDGTDGTDCENKK